MREVQTRTGDLREGDIARHGDLFGRGGHPRETEPCGYRALMHDPLCRKRVVLRMLDDGPAGHPRVLERATEQAGVLHR
jgi:hypothetical protein